MNIETLAPPVPKPDPHADLELLSQLQLLEEKDRLVTKGKALTNDPVVGWTSALSDAEVERLSAIIGQLRRRASSQPKASAKPKGASDDEVLSL